MSFKCVQTICFLASNSWGSGVWSIKTYFKWITVHVLVCTPNCHLNIKSTYCVRWRLRWRWRRRRRKLPFWTTTAVTGLSWIDVWAGIFKANGQFSIAASASSKATAAGRASMATATFYQRNGAYATYKGGYVLIKNNGILQFLLLLPPPDLFDLHLSGLCVRGQATVRICIFLFLFFQSTMV